MIQEPQITIEELLGYMSGTSPEAGAISWDDSNVTIPFDVPGDKLYDTCTLLLGYCFIGNITSTLRTPGTIPSYSWSYLNRRNPMRHPKFTWMHCTKIESILGLGARGRQDVINPTSLPTLPAFTSKYELYRVTAQFSSPQYDVIEDVDMKPRGQENQRFFWRSGKETTASFITIEGQSLQFVEGPPAAGTTAGRFVGAGRAMPETTQLIKYTWTKVAADYVEDSTTGMPTKLDQALQCVNSEPFLGCPAYTLLMDPYSYERKRMPISDSTAAPEWWVEVVFNFRYFNPPKKWAGSTDPKAVGWFLAPSSADGLYYHVKRTGPPLTELFAQCDFNKLTTPKEDVMVVTQ